MFAYVNVAAVALRVLAFLQRFLIWPFRPLLKFFDWKELAQEFGASEQPEGQRFHCCMAQYGWVAYRGVIAVTVCEQGLFVQLEKWSKYLLPLDNPPLMIPWARISFTVRKTRGWERLHKFSFHYMWPHITARMGPLMICLPMAAREYLLRHAQHWDENQ